MSKSSFGNMLAKNERERALMDYWYQRGYHDSETAQRVNKLPKKKVTIVVTDKLRVKKAKKL